MFYSDFITVFIVQCITSSSGACESLFLKANIPPHKSVDEFCNFMENTFEFLENSPLVVMSDFNINSVNETLSTRNYNDLFHQ